MKNTLYQIGDDVKVEPDNDNENYNSFRDKVLTITHVATNEQEHPGYDNSMEGSGLYDLETEEGEEICCSLYDYELEPA